MFKASGCICTKASLRNSSGKQSDVGHFSKSQVNMDP